MRDNPNCDGGDCVTSIGEVRVLPHGKNPNHGNSILCIACFHHEIRFREQRNKELSKDAQYDLPKWIDLKIYGGDGE